MPHSTMLHSHAVTLLHREPWRPRCFISCSPFAVTTPNTAAPQSPEQHNNSMRNLLSCALQGISRLCRQYLQQEGQQLKAAVQQQGGQLVVEVRRNHVPEIRACYGAHCA